MIANRRSRFSLLSIACAVTALLAGCAAERRPAPPPTPAPAPRPIAAPAPLPAASDWRDAPLTPGTWRYVAAAGISAARFGTETATLLSLRCDRAQGRVTLARAGAAEGGVPLTVTTTSAARAFTATPVTESPPQLVVALAPRDPLLDAIAFSRGRFAVEAPGLPPLYVPAWPEVGRVIEDCR